MDTTTALAVLEPAYARLNLDAAAAGPERLTVWHSYAKRKIHRSFPRQSRPFPLLDRQELSALRIVCAVADERKADGEECFEHVALAPQTQLCLLGAWVQSGESWLALPLHEKRSKPMQTKSKALVNVVCCRRQRDAWKQQSVYFQARIKAAAAFAARRPDLAWCDLQHRIVFELMASSDSLLRAVAATLQLPRDDDPDYERRLAIYERGVVALLRLRPPLVLDTVLRQVTPPRTTLQHRLLGHITRARASDVGLRHLAQQPLRLNDCGGLRLLRDGLVPWPQHHGLQLAIAQRALPLVEALPRQSMRDKTLARIHALLGQRPRLEHLLHQARTFQPRRFRFELSLDLPEIETGATPSAQHFVPVLPPKIGFLINEQGLLVRMPQ